MKKKTKTKTKAARRELRKNIAKVVKAGLEPLKRPPPVGKNIPAEIKAPNFGQVRGESWVKPGRYVMKNGSSATVIEPVTLRFGVQMRQTWQGWKGILEGHNGEGIVWGLDGKRSDATPAHEHDLVKRHKNQNYTCTACGCTDARACKGGCSWVAPGRCSKCFAVPA